MKPLFLFYFSPSLPFYSFSPCPSLSIFLSLSSLFLFFYLPISFHSTPCPCPSISSFSFFSSSLSFFLYFLSSFSICSFSLSLTLYHTLSSLTPLCGINIGLIFAAHLSTDPGEREKGKSASSFSKQQMVIEEQEENMACKKNEWA